MAGVQERLAVLLLGGFDLSYWRGRLGKSHLWLFPLFRQGNGVPFV